MTTSTASPATLPTITIRVRDVYCGTKGCPVEECITTNEQEADGWFKQWKKEYTADRGYEGYKVERKISPAAGV